MGYTGANSAGSGLRENKSLDRHSSNHIHVSPVQMFLNRLENVREYGRGWRARCPAHGGKSNNTLSVAEGDDGRVLIHCFGGCETLDILKVCGLEAGDLFQKRISHNSTPAERRELRELARQSQWRAALPSLYSEAVVVLVAAGMVNRGEALSAEDDQRLLLAIERIESAKGVLGGR